MIEIGGALTVVAAATGVLAGKSKTRSPKFYVLVGLVVLSGVGSVIAQREHSNDLDDQREKAEEDRVEAERDRDAQYHSLQALLEELGVESSEAQKISRKQIVSEIRKGIQRIESDKKYEEFSAGLKGVEKALFDKIASSSQEVVTAQEGINSRIDAVKETFEEVNDALLGQKEQIGAIAVQQRGLADTTLVREVASDILEGIESVSQETGQLVSELPEQQARMEDVEKKAEGNTKKSILGIGTSAASAIGTIAVAVLK
jgi:hypothetical protein